MSTEHFFCQKLHLCCKTQWQRSSVNCCFFVRVNPVKFAFEMKNIFWLTWPAARNGNKEWAEQLSSELDYGFKLLDLCCWIPDHKYSILVLLLMLLHHILKMRPPSVFQQNRLRRPCSQPRCSQRIGSHAAHSRKSCNNNRKSFVNDFHIHTEVSSVEAGNHLRVCQACMLSWGRIRQHRLCVEYTLPPAVL